MQWFGEGRRNNAHRYGKNDQDNEKNHACSYCEVDKGAKARVVPLMAN
jgi:hypothetical protein